VQPEPGGVAEVAETIFLSDSDFRVLDEEDFGVDGLVAHEWVGPFVEVQAIGPLIMVHDGVFDPRKGIGHHPHRLNERLFYILEGAVDHDDSLNGITGHMATGDLGRLTEGTGGMLHQEWNNTDGRARAFILVYGTDPTPPTASFTTLRDADAPRYESGPGVRTKEIVGPRTAFPVNGDVRLFTDDHLEAGAELRFDLGDDEGGLVFPLEGEARMDGRALRPETMVLVPPAPGRRSIRVASPAGTRLLRAAYGPGYGLVLRSRMRR
jgi:redox-sensitive bicupin YhaK (pirin superfamily)